MWSQSTIEQYISGQIQENLNLEYKSAKALSKDDHSIAEISKDVSSMANSQGGVIIYGVKEFDEKAKRHLPEKIDPIDQTLFTKEWLEQVITSNIRPRIQGLVIYPVQIESNTNDSVYVVEVQQSNTAHQAKDLRYYKRHNFKSEPMEDYEIRDIMNRANVPNVSIRFGLYDGVVSSEDAKIYTLYRGLKIILKNEGEQVVNRFKVQMTLTNVGWYDDDEDGDFQFPNLVEISDKESMDIKTSMRGHSGFVDWHILYKPEFVLFPQEEIDIGELFKWGYRSDVRLEVVNNWKDFARDANWQIKWKLFADNMPFKEGVEMVCDLPTLIH